MGASWSSALVVGVRMGASKVSFFFIPSGSVTPQYSRAPCE
jgi:hypothetical protein